MNKPQEILDLERYLHRSLIEVKNVNRLPSVGGNFYILDGEEVIGLSLNEIKIHDISFLSNFPHLKHLFCAGCQIDDISHVSSLKFLETLVMSANKISDVSCISYMSSLKEIDFSNNKIDVLPSLDNLPLLEKIYVPINRIKHIPNFQHLKNLVQFQVESNPIIFDSPYIFQAEAEYKIILYCYEIDRVLTDEWAINQIMNGVQPTLQNFIETRKGTSVFDERKGKVEYDGTSYCPELYKIYLNRYETPKIV